MEIALSFRDTLIVDELFDDRWEVLFLSPGRKPVVYKSPSLEFCVRLVLAGTRYDVDVVLDRLAVAA